VTEPDDDRPVQRLLREPRPGALPKQGSLRWSFTWAFEGIVFVLRTQRNMQVHVAAGMLVLILALVLGVSRFELLALVIVVSLVLVVRCPLSSCRLTTIPGTAAELSRTRAIR
jgi:hypothetical protein